MKYSEAKKYRCVFCNSDVTWTNKYQHFGGKKRITRVRCSNPECESMPMTVKDWVMRGMYYEKKGELTKSEKIASPVGINRSEMSKNGMISALSKINHINEKVEKKQKKVWSSRKVPDWVFLAVRWAREYGGLRVKDISIAHGSDVSQILNYGSRSELIPKPENKKDWERLLSEGWRNN